MKTKILALISLVVGLAAFNTIGLAQDKAQDKTDVKNPGKELRAAVDRVNSASAVINEVMKINDKAIPTDLLKRAKAIVVFPGTLKAAFIIGGQGGKGVAIRRVGNGWSAPAFLNLGGGSFGAQIGGQKTDYVMIIMNDNGLKHLLDDKFEIGGEGSVSAGPVGRTAAASTNVTLDAEILTYSRSKGLFAGVSLKGVVISQDQDINNAVYQKSASRLSAIHRFYPPTHLKLCKSFPTLSRTTLNKTVLLLKSCNAASKAAFFFWLTGRANVSFIGMTNRIEVFRQMLDADPENTMVMFGLAKEYEKLGQNEEIIALLETYISKADDEGNAYGVLATAYAKSGNAAKAMETYKKGIDVATTHGHPSMANEYRITLDLDFEE